MPGSPDLFPQRRPAKASDSDPPALFLFSSAKDLPKDLAMIRTQESFKGVHDNHFSLTPASRAFFKSILLLVGIVTVLSAFLIFGSGVLLARANFLGRQCLDVKPSGGGPGIVYRFAMVTCTDKHNFIPGRSFEGLMDLVTPNKLSYVKRHGYEFIDASDLLDKERPPSWSKILAVRKHLPNFDWVFWNDADSLVTNPAIALEDIIESTVGSVGLDDMPDFIVTEDVTGVNAGMFFFRNSNWSMQFLDLWWNQTSFVRPFGQMKSGDNDALKYLIQNMPEEERKQHVRIPRMQCVFNSNLWRPSLKSGHRLMTLTRTVWQGVYSKGDFMVHLAGLNDKKRWIQKILKDIREEEISSENFVRKVGPKKA